MQLLTAVEQYFPQAKKLWKDNFINDTAELCDFIFDNVDSSEIYLAVENEHIVAMVIAAASLECEGQKGFYLYSACTDKSQGSDEILKSLVNYALDDMKTKGYIFCVVKPENMKMAQMFTDVGFNQTIKMRKAEIEIKKNIWQSAEFDIATASRLKTIRSKFCDEKIVHYTAKDYEKYAMYLYTFGGSTAENEQAFAVYYISNNKLIVKEMLAENTVQATKLLQAIRERTGCETAEIYLSKESNLFLGDGKLQDVYMVHGFDSQRYINLMLD